jgi:hypothetical protein
MSNLTIVTRPFEYDNVIKELFKEIYINDGNEKYTPDDFAKVNHFGNNNSKIFIGVTNDTSAILNNAERGLLQKILGAVKLTEDDVFITSLNNIQPGLFNNFISHNNFNKLFFFGIIPEQLGWHIEMKHYQRMSFMEKELLFAESLSVISVNEAAKKKLWVQLQLIFNIK